MARQFWVYILSSKSRGALYVGMTSDLGRRVWEHKNNLVEGFTSKYKADRLVYYEALEESENALQRERQLKKWRRAWKIQLIEKVNPEWKDLYEEITA
jgi:putative endonuclease